MNPQNSGFRVGSTPIILRLSQKGGANNQSPQGAAKQVDVFCESVKILQIRNGLVDTIDA